VSAFALGTLSDFWESSGSSWGDVPHTMTVVTGKFEIVKESIVHISFDPAAAVRADRFFFRAIIEGTRASARRWPSPAP